MINVHKKFKQFHYKGEWFKYDDSMIEYIKAMCGNIITGDKNEIH